MSSLASSRRYAVARVLPIIVALALEFGTGGAVLAAAGRPVSNVSAAASAAHRLTAVYGRSSAAGASSHTKPSHAGSSSPKRDVLAEQASSNGATAGFPAARGSALASASIATTTTLSATPNPAPYGTPVHLLATVTPAPQPYLGFTPAVSFYVDGTVNEAAPIDGVTGEASVDKTFTPGTYQVKAVFGGLGDYLGSESSTVAVSVVQLPPLGSITGSASLQSAAGFSAMAAQSAFDSAEPNSSIAVGPSHIVQASNVGIAFYKRPGTFLYGLALPDFFAIEPAGQLDTARDPRVAYVPGANRWLATEVTRDGTASHLYVAASNGADPSAGWWTYRFDFANEAPMVPSLGFSGDKVVVGYDATQISDAASLGARLLVLDLSAVLGKLNSIAYARGTGATYHDWRAAPDLSAATDVHAVGYDDAGHLLHAVVTGQVGSTSVTYQVVDLTAIAGGPAGVGAPLTVLIGTGPNTLTNMAIPLGPTDALWSGGNLWFVSSHSCVPASDMSAEVCVRVTEVATASLALEQDFAIARTGHADFLGGIGLAADGNLFIAYSDVAVTGFPADSIISTYATVHEAADAANTVRPPALVAKGATYWPGAPWGALAPVARDPSDAHAVWQGLAVAVAGGWTTWISQLRAATAAPAGTVAIDGGRTNANSLAVNLAASPASGSAATRILVSNAATTAAGVLTAAKEFAIGTRTPWSLSDPSTGGSGATGPRTVYYQFGDGTGHWSTVATATITIDTPLGAIYTTLPAVRLLDTRYPIGLSGAFRSGVPRTFQVTGRGGVPSNAIAVTGNLTVTGQTTRGFVFLGPTATSTPASSTLNFPVGDNRANGVTVRLGAGGTLSAVFVGSSSAATTQLLFDVTGYFVGGDAGATYTPMSPARVLDTRNYGAAGKLVSAQWAYFFVGGVVGVPGDAVAVTGNVTVTNQTTKGYVFVGQLDSVHNGSPSTSTVNFPVGDNRANNVTVALGASGELYVVFYGATSTATTDFVFDVTGYFLATPGGGTFVPLAPARLLDTRSGNGLTGPFTSRVSRTFQVSGRGGVPAKSLAVTGNLTVTQQTATGYVFLGPIATNTPTSSTLNFPVGDNRANGVSVALSSMGTLSATYAAPAGATTALIFDVSGYYR